MRVGLRLHKFGKKKRRKKTGLKMKKKIREGKAETCFQEERSAS